jgi:nitrate reductase alpha subunit
MLVTLVEHPGGHGLTASKFLTAADLPSQADVADAAFKTVLWDTAASAPAVPNGTMGHRYNEDGQGKWNLDLGELVPALSLAEVDGSRPVEIALPCF